MNILITGGAGYIGTTLIPLLVDNKHKVTVMDNLMFGGDQLLQFFRYDNFDFLKGDIRSPKDVVKAVKGKDVIVHLAAIVGYPACRRFPELAREVNIKGSKIISKSLSKNQLLIFASTESSYGDSGKMITEDSPLNPLSLYGQSKAIAEDIFLKNNLAVSLRFASGFGVSSRMRLDSLINDFVYKAITQKYLVVYEKNHKRSFIHVSDMARAILLVIEKNREMKGQAYNVGSERLNVSKEEICLTIKRHIDCYVHYAEVEKDLEKRDYSISYKKIQTFGFSTTKDIDKGVKELIRANNAIIQKTPYANI
jgi:nucleoside-diphosphate-sugar epimerase